MTKPVLISSFSPIQSNIVESALLQLRSGSASCVYDQAGNRYVDAVSGLWNHCFGFNHEELTDAAKLAYEEFAGYHCMHQGGCVSTYEFAAKLAEKSPVNSSLVFFSNSGSEAIETAVKSVWFVNVTEGRPDKNKVISRHGAYHGVTIFANSLLGKSYADLFGPRDPRVHFVDCPDRRNFDEGATDDDIVDQLLAEIEALISSEGADTIAAFVAEPIVGVGGVLIPPATYFPRLRKVLDAAEIMLIADEVICGFMRTGSFWGSQSVGLEPDILATSKAISAGFFPVAATIYSTSFSERLEQASAKAGEFPHGHTTSGHPVGCRIGLKTLEIMERDVFLAEYQATQDEFTRHLTDLAQHVQIGDMRQIGLLAGFDLAPDVQIDASDLVRACRERGVIMRSSGNTLMLAPAYNMSAKEFDTVFSTFAETLNDFERAA